MAAPEGTTMDTATDATTEEVGGAYATYKELYTTKDYAAEGISVETLVDTFGLKGENPKTSTQLYDSVKYGGDRAPLLFMMAVRGESLMHVLHRPFVLATPLGATPTSWQGEVLMFGDNVIGQQLVNEKAYRLSFCEDPFLCDEAFD